MRVLAVEGLAVEADSLAPAVLWPSSWSSVISSSFCLREDRLEELLEGAAVCSEHALVRLSADGIDGRSLPEGCGGSVGPGKVC